MTAPVRAPDLLGPDTLDHLPAAVRRPAYDRAALRPGMAHIGVGAFHRCHQAEFTDDMLEVRFGRWGVAGINLRPPTLADTLGRQHGLYTRVLRSGEQSEARIIGCHVLSIDSQDSPGPALAVLAAADIDVATITVTEKGYCHRPATGALDPDHPDIRHDLAHPETPRSLPGLLARALDLRRRLHGRPITLISCDNIPGNGTILAGVVRSLAEPRPGLPAWIDQNAAFPSTMVDRIVPATTPADLAALEHAHGYRDTAAVGGEPFRQWVIESRFAGRIPPWDLAGASFVDDVTPFEHLKMRVLNAAQSTLACLGVLAGHEHTCDAIADPLLEAFTRRMLVTETVPTFAPVPGTAPLDYVDQSLARLHNTAIRHRCHQIATDSSQKLPQRLINPAAERLARGLPIPHLAIAIASWMAYLIRASDRFGRQWPAEDPEAAHVAAIADRIGNDPAALVAGILALDTVFDPALAAREAFRKSLATALAGLLSPDPMTVVRRLREER